MPEPASLLMTGPPRSLDAEATMVEATELSAAREQTLDRYVGQLSSDDHTDSRGFRFVTIFSEELTLHTLNHVQSLEWY